MKTPYKVLRETAIRLLEEKVNEAIAEGWEPVGGIAVSVLQDAHGFAKGFWFYQAVIIQNVKL